MEEQLKARKLGSAKVRRQRHADRQRSRDLVREQREERKKRLQRYSAAYSNPDTDDSRSNSLDDDSLAETPSEISVRTPDNMSSSELNTKGKINVTIASVDEDASDERVLAHETADRSTSKPLAGPRMLGASLNRPCDFRYDRYSTIMAIPDLQNSNQDEDTASDPGHSSGDGEDSDDDYYSPIEIATPVTLFMPQSKPSVISVSICNPKKRVHRLSTKNEETTFTINTTDANAKRMSVRTQPIIHSNTTGSGFFAGEAQPVETPCASSISVVSMNSSRSASVSSASRDDAHVPVKKKRSVPMLSKLTHVRMKSIKNFIAPLSPSLAPPMPQSPYTHQGTHQSRSSAGLSSLLGSTSSHSSQLSSASIPNTANIAPSPPTRSSTEPFGSSRLVSDQRPRTAKPVETTSTIVDSPSDTQTGAQNEATLSRRKSFTNLRRRSGSIGQALKLSSSKTKSPSIDVQAPPMPSLQTHYDPARFSSSMLTPQPLLNTPESTPNLRKSSINGYSPFPTVSKQGQPLGLGLLRM